MTYFDGFLMPVPSGNKDGFIAYSHHSDTLFAQHGARRIVECWPQSVDAIALSSAGPGIDARDGEAVAFSWIEWRDKDARMQGMAALDPIIRTDPHFNPDINPPPFDTGRVMWGCFETLADLGQSAEASVVQALVFVARDEQKEAIRHFATQAWLPPRDAGALRMVIGWDDGAQAGHQNSSFEHLRESNGGKAALLFVEWPSTVLPVSIAAAFLPIFGFLSEMNAATVYSGLLTPIVQVAAAD